MGKEVFESFRTSAIFQSLYQSCKFDSNLHKGMIAGLESKNEGPNSIHSKSQEFLDNIKTGFQDSGLDVEFQWQGLFVGMLKVPRFDTDNVFAWISDLGKEEPFNFSSTLYSHFLLRSENVKLTYIDSQKDKILTFGSLEVVDCILNEQPKQGSAPIDMGSGNRVDIQGLDSDSMNMSMSFTNADLFQSFIKFDDSHPLEYCKEKVMLKLVPVPIEGSLSKPPVIKVKLDLGSIPQIEIFIHKILIDFDLESFKLMADRKAMYEEIMQICQLVVAEKKRGESESQMAHEARLLFDGVTAFSLQQMLAGLTELYKALQIDNVKEQLTREWKIVLPHTLTQAQSMKIDLHITHFEAKVGGRIDPEAGKSSYMILKGGSMNVLMQKLILISWKQPIEIATETELGRHVVLKVTGEKENVVGIDDKNMVVKISAVEVMISPAIFEGILLLTQFVGSKLDRLEFNHQKYQIVKSLTTLFELQTQSYLLYQEEGQVNRMVKQIDSLIYQAPPLVEKAYIYLGHIDLQIFDEDITRDIIESSIAQRRRMLDDYDDFVVVDEQSNQRSIREDLHDDIEKKEKILREKNEVIHLELKPLMVKLELGPKPSMMLLIHTIMLQDGLTYISMKKDRLRYPTHFCELYSINYNQPTFDANLSKKFEIKQCLSSFREILKRFKKEKPFLQITQYIDIDEDLNRTVQKMNIDVSSIVFRVSMKTSKEIFACLIRIIDSTLMRLDNISVLFQKLREANTTDEMKLYRRKQSIKNQSMNQMKAQETGSAISINIDSVYLDIFYEGSYRLLFKITSTEISMSDNPRLNQPTQVECTKLIMAFTTSDEHTRKKGVEQMEDKATYFKVLSLQSMVVKMTQPIDQGVPTTDIQVILPTKNKRNLLLMIDLDFLSVLLELLRTFSSLLSHAKSKTQFIFKDFNEYIDKQPEVPLRKEKEFEEAGVHEAEKLAVLKQFMIFSDNLMSTDFQDDVPDEEKVQELSDDDLNTIERKLRSAIGFLTDMFFDKFADKASNLNLKVYLDKVTVNIYQNFDFHSHSYISLKLGRVSGVVNINSTSSETSRKSERTLSTTSAILSARSIKIVDNTTGSMFKYLLKIPHHSLNMFFRSREVSEKYLKETINSIKPTYVVERFMDKIAFTLMLNPIQIFIDDKSVASLKTFTEKLITILKFNQQEDNLVISEKKEAGKAPPEQGQEIIVDFIYIGDIRLGLIARSATNVSLANVIPDINFDLGVGPF
jgi:hypothetical protein